MNIKKRIEALLWSFILMYCADNTEPGWMQIIGNIGSILWMGYWVFLSFTDKDKED